MASTMASAVTASVTASVTAAIAAAITSTGTSAAASTTAAAFGIGRGVGRRPLIEVESLWSKDQRGHGKTKSYGMNKGSALHCIPPSRLQNRRH
jgi:hypothetical protein